MIQFKTGRCPICGKLAELVPSNNPLVAPVCSKCIENEIDVQDLNQADYFCRTMNIPFLPDVWIPFVEKNPNTVIKDYVGYCLENYPHNLVYEGVTRDLWKQVNEEWNKNKNFEMLLDKLEPVKEGFMQRCKIKWGGEYQFDQYVQLESLLTGIMRANAISNPMQIDAIKKACRISIKLDEAIEANDAKGIKELSTAYASFVKTAQIDDIITEDNEDVIQTVAQLGEYIEQCGGEFQYYDHVERDIVDKTINDMKQYLKTLVEDSVGLRTTYENIAMATKRAKEDMASEKAAEETSVFDLEAAYNKTHNVEEFDNQDILSDLDGEEDDDDDGYF